MVSIENKVVVSGSFTDPKEELADPFTITISGDDALLDCVGGPVKISHADLARAMMLYADVMTGKVKLSTRNYTKIALP